MLQSARDGLGPAALPSTRFEDWPGFTPDMHNPPRFVGLMLGALQVSGVAVNLDHAFQGTDLRQPVGKRLFPNTLSSAITSIAERCIDATASEALQPAALHLGRLAAECTADEQPELAGLWRLAMSMCSPQAINPDLPRYSSSLYVARSGCNQAEVKFCEAITNYVDPKSCGESITPIRDAAGVPLFIEKSMTCGETTALATSSFVVRANQRLVEAPAGSLVELAPGRGNAPNVKGAAVGANVIVTFLRLSRFAFPPDMRDQLFCEIESDMASLSIDEIKALCA